MRIEPYLSIMVLMIIFGGKNRQKTCENSHIWQGWVKIGEKKQFWPFFQKAPRRLFVWKHDNFLHIFLGHSYFLLSSGYQIWPNFRSRAMCCAFISRRLEIFLSNLVNSQNFCLCSNFVVANLFGSLLVSLFEHHVLIYLPNWMMSVLSFGFMR